ncbi:winged helix-turn-helix domain-containing protein [Candidatus Pelagibacter sp.]|jgi:DNA-binding CsgD family transcriptional regulator|nr:winged helix-turn-helix domain-containing protein [Candidatus Pelagibacter sp.]
MQNVIIINYNSLYEIFDDLKENLPFKTIKFKNEDDFLKDNSLDKRKSLIILNKKTKLLFNHGLHESNILYLNDLPLSFEKLLEKININLIKLRYGLQSKINIKDFQLDVNSKHLSKLGLTLKLTEKEIEIILYLNKKKINCDIADLQKNIWGYSANIETHTVETHIYRLRKKIDKVFKDKKFIVSQKNGYLIG